MAPVRSAPHPDAADAVGTPARLAALGRTALLDSAAEGAFDRFTRLAARLLGVPVALVSLVAADRQFFKSSHGLPEPWASARETPLTHSFCQHVVATRAPLAVPDARAHAVLHDNLAIPDLGVVAYLGVPIEADGEVIGSLCAIDGAARAWTDADLAALQDLADALRTEIVLRAALAEGRAARRTAELLLSASPDAFVAVDGAGYCTYLSERAARHLGRPAAEVVGTPLAEHLPPVARAVAADLGAAVRDAAAPLAAEYHVATAAAPDGRWVSVHAAPESDGGVAVALRDVTAQRDAQAALRAREAVLRQFVDHAPAAVALLDRDLRYVAASRRWLTEYGLTARGLTTTSILGRSHDEVFPDAPARWRAELRRVLGGAVLRSEDDAFARADGTVEHVRYELHPWRGDDDAVAGVVMFTEVITERVAIADALRASEARSRAVADTASDAIVSADASGTITYWNAAATRIFGYAEHEAVGASLTLIMPAGYRGAHEAGLARVAGGGPSRLAGQVLALEGRRRSGAVFPIELSMTHYRVDDAPCFTAIIRDVTERRRAEAELRASEARYRALVEQSPEPVLLHRDGRVLYANAAAASVLGYADATALVDVPILDLLHPDDRATAVSALARLAAGAPDPHARHYRVVRPDGTRREVECTSAAVDVDAAPAVQTLLRDVTERNRLQRELTHQAFHDPLTGLANRVLFRDRVEHALARVASARAGHAEHVAVLYLDLDDFKSVNDTLGHDAGDRLLVAAAERLLKATRGYDTVARLGGDEFAVLLEGMGTPADADVVVARVARALTATVALGGTMARVRASVGLAHATGEEDADALLRNADLAMYDAKARAKAAETSAYAVFAPAMHHAVLSRTSLEADLRGAVEALVAGAGGGFRLVYQPVVDLRTGRVLAFEALMRWQHPTRGAVPPTVFIPVAEETGLVVTLGRWALGEACRWLAAWDDATAGGGRRRVNVNVSGRQLGDTPLVADVAAALAAAGLGADRLTLEVTETAVMRDAARALETLRALKALGVTLAVDDFGTGYSSLSYLQQLPVDVLKIDKAFVDGVARGGPGAALARTVIALGETLGLRTVAEGIEHEAQRAALVALGCPCGQGYLFARPLEAEAAGRLITAPVRTA